MRSELPPRIVIIEPDQWPRAGLRAELREAGYDAIGATSIDQAERYVLPDPERGPVRLVIVDHDAADTHTIDTLGRWKVALGARAILLAHATRQAPVGPWDLVLVRPVSVGDVVAAAQRLLSS